MKIIVGSLLAAGLSYGVVQGYKDFTAESNDKLTTYAYTVKKLTELTAYLKSLPGMSLDKIKDIIGSINSMLGLGEAVPPS
jgi:hypothetical protein